MNPLSSCLRSADASTPLIHPLIALTHALNSLVLHQISPEHLLCGTHQFRSFTRSWNSLTHSLTHSWIYSWHSFTHVSLSLNSLTFPRRLRKLFLLSPAGLGGVSPDTEEDQVTLPPKKPKSVHPTQTLMQTQGPRSCRHRGPTRYLYIRRISPSPTYFQTRSPNKVPLSHRPFLCPASLKEKTILVLDVY